MTRGQHGFSLIAAIFLVVIVALVAGFMVTIGGIAHSTPAFSVMGARTYFAAASGIEWGTQQVLANALAPSCFANPTTFVVESNFNVTLTCSATPVTEGTVSYVVFDLTATAEAGTRGQEDYFSRILAASVSSAQ